MKQILVLVAIIGLCANLCLALDEEFIQDLMKKMQQIGDECMKETGASDDDIGTLLERKIPDTKEGKCMIKCFGVHLGMSTADGNYSEEGTKAAFAPLKEKDEELYNTMIQIANECYKETTKLEDMCETATNYFSCSLRKEKEKGLQNGIFSK